MTLSERIKKYQVAREKRKRMVSLMKDLTKDGGVNMSTIERYGFYLIQAGNNDKIPLDDTSACRCLYNGRTYMLSFGSTDNSKADHAGVQINVYATHTASTKGGNIRMEISAKVSEQEVKCQQINFVNHIDFASALDSNEPKSYFDDISSLLASSMLYTLSTYVKEQELP